ncbi:MAG TPA: 6,7-dimethyl-8-ribityllumazine synthase [Rickettsiales bacterium]|nr:6,7-dimethyl-8-ribityllumazine synthase [Rickettsiales bacterium]
MSHIFVVVARFYEDLADELIRGAEAALKKAGATHDVFEVPGAFEIPSAINMAIASGRYDGFVALGCVIRGETTHYDYVCGESARGLNQLALDYLAPIGYGILTVENPEQAWVRADVKQGNKGKDAVEACLRMLAIKKQMNLDE